jgi:predicted RNase H-like HicB family nuclease
MTKHKFVVIVEQDEDGNYIGSVPDLKGCNSYGSTMDELLKNMVEAIGANIEALIKENKEIPISNFTGIHEIEIEV